MGPAIVSIRLVYSFVSFLGGEFWAWALKPVHDSIFANFQRCLTTQIKFKERNIKLTSLFLCGNKKWNKESWNNHFDRHTIPNSQCEGVYWKYFIWFFFSSNVKCLCETLNFCLLARVVCSLALLPNEHFETHSIASFYCHFLQTDCYVYDIESIESAQSWVVWIHSSHCQHQIHSFTLKNGICSAKNISLPIERGN